MSADSATIAAAMSIRSPELFTRDPSLAKRVGGAVRHLLTAIGAMLRHSNDDAPAKSGQSLNTIRRHGMLLDSCSTEVLQDALSRHDPLSPDFEGADREIVLGIIEGLLDARTERNGGLR